MAKTFEALLDEIETNCSKLEAGQLDIEKATALHQRTLELIDEAEKLLRQYGKEIRITPANAANGTPE